MKCQYEKLQQELKKAEEYIAELERSDDGHTER
jgi:hypothetical protein